MLGAIMQACNPINWDAQGRREEKRVGERKKEDGRKEWREGAIAALSSVKLRHFLA